MKKFLLTSLAALFAVVSFAQVGVKKQVVTLTNEPAPIAKVMDRQSVVKNVKAPQGQKLFAKKNLRRAAISSIDELQGEFIVCNYEYSYDSEAEQLVPADVSRKGFSANIEVTGTNTIAIYGIDGNATDAAITATVDVENSTITIPANQLIWTYTDEESGEKTDFLMTNASTEGDFTGTIYEGGVIEINEIWFEGYVEGGETYRNGNFKGTFIAPVNGIMEYSSTDEEDNPIQVSQNVLIEQDDETKEVTVWNVHNFIYGMVMDVKINSDKSFLVSGGEQVIYMHSTLNEIYLYGSPKANTIGDITGKVEDNTKLVSDTGFGYVNVSYRGWVFPNDKFTITLVDGTEFEYPEVETGELVVLPEGVTPVAMPCSYAIRENETRVKKTGIVNVAVADGVVYFQGFDLQIPEAWVKGTLDAESGIITIPVTYTGVVNETAHFFAGYGSNDQPAEFKIEYDAKANTYYSPDWVEFFKSSTGNEDYYYGGLFIGTKPTPYTMPETAVAVEKPFTGKFLNTSTGEYEEKTGNVKVAKEGNMVYIQGLYSSYFKNDCILGQMIENNGNKYVVFPVGEYVGELASGFQAFLLSYSYDQATESSSLNNVVFVYDETNDVYTLGTPLVLSRSSMDINYYVDIISSGLTIGTEPDGIAVTKSDVKSGNAQMFNLAGQRVGKDYKGLVIKNGKKMFNK